MGTEESIVETSEDVKIRNFIEQHVKEGAVGLLKYNLEEVRPEGLELDKLDVELSLHEYRIEQINFRGDKKYPKGFAIFDLLVDKVAIPYPLRVDFNPLGNKNAWPPHSSLSPQLKTAFDTGLHIDEQLEAEIIKSIVEKVQRFWFNCAICGKPIKTTIHKETRSQGYGGASYRILLSRVPVATKGAGVHLDFGDVRGKLSELKIAKKDALVKEKLGTVDISDIEKLLKIKDKIERLIKELVRDPRFEAESDFVVCGECLFEKIECIRNLTYIMTLAEAKEIFSLKIELEEGYSLEDLLNCGARIQLFTGEQVY